MNWNPELMAPSNLALWQVALSWVIMIPATFAMFMVLVVSGITAVNIVEAASARSFRSAGPVRRFFMTFFEGPVFAVLTQVFLCVVLITAICGGGRRYQ